MSFTLVDEQTKHMYLINVSTDDSLRFQKPINQKNETADGNWSMEMKETIDENGKLKWNYHVKTEIEEYKAKLLSKDVKIRSEAINHLATSGDIKKLNLLMKILFEKRIGNGPSIAIKTIGNSQNEVGQSILKEIYGTANSNEKKLIIEALFKLGAFKKFFSGNQFHKNIQEQLWTLLFGLNSDQLKKILALEQKEFLEKLDFAWKATKHWRNNTME